MLVDRFKQLFFDLAAEGNAPDTPDPTPVDILPETGEHQESITTLGKLRDVIPVLKMLVPSQTGMAMTANEVAAWDILSQHCFSREAMIKSGILEGYKSLGITTDLETRWRAAFAAMLLDDYKPHPEGLKTVMALVEEYQDTALMRRVLAVLDDAVTEEHMNGEALIGSIRRCLETLNRDVFDTSFTEVMRTELMELADRAEYHLATYDQGTRWREMLEELRNARRTV